MIHFRVKSDGTYWAVQEARNHAWRPLCPTILTYKEATKFLWELLDLNHDIINP